MAAKAGKVKAAAGAFRAHVQYRGVTKEKHNIYGPRRKTEAGAQSDLDSMRGAAAEYSNDRTEAYEAMQVEAARILDRAARTKEIGGPLSKAGQVVDLDGEFRARVHYTASTGQEANLYGPRRADACAAALIPPSGKLKDISA